MISEDELNKQIEEAFNNLILYDEKNNLNLSDDQKDLIRKAIKYLNLNGEQKIRAVIGNILENSDEVRHVYKSEQTGFTRSELQSKLDALAGHAESLKFILEEPEIIRAIEYCADFPDKACDMLVDLILIAEKTQSKFQDPDGVGDSEPVVGRGRAIRQVELSATALLVRYADDLYCLCHSLKEPLGETNPKYWQFLEYLWGLVVNNAPESTQDWRRAIRTARMQGKDVPGSLSAHLSARVGASLSIEKIRNKIHPPPPKFPTTDKS